LLLALSYFVEVPRHERDDSKRNGDEKDEDDNEQSSAAGGTSCIAGAECVVMVVMHFDSSVAAGIGWRVCIDDNSFVTLTLSVRRSF
jgi:hypothetical protein